MKTVNSATDVTDFVDELGAGVFKEKLALILSEVALGTLTHGYQGKKGKISIDFTFHKMDSECQLVISHKLTKCSPTKRGKKLEEDTTETVFFAGRSGVLTINPPKEDANGQKNFELVDK